MTRTCEDIAHHGTTVEWRGIELTCPLCDALAALKRARTMLGGEIMTPDLVHAAQEAIARAVEHEEAQQKAAIAEALAQGRSAPVFEALSLRKRAWPLLEMLQRCAKANEPITWGV